MKEQTLVMIKPDGVAKGLTDEIVARIERVGLKIVSTRRMKLDRKLAEELYSVHRGKEIFERAVNHALSGEVVVMMVEGVGAIARMRELIGATDPAKAAKGTIRSDFGTNVTVNVIHAADSAESARREIQLFFNI